MKRSSKQALSPKLLSHRNTFLSRIFFESGLFLTFLATFAHLSSGSSIHFVDFFRWVKLASCTVVYRGFNYTTYYLISTSLFLAKTRVKIGPLSSENVWTRWILPADRLPLDTSLCIQIKCFEFRHKFGSTGCCQRGVGSNLLNIHCYWIGSRLLAFIFSTGIFLLWNLEIKLGIARLKNCALFIKSW